MKPRTQRLSHISSLISFLSSVRVRLTLWYLVTITFILLMLGWAVATAQANLSADALDNQIETQLYQDIQPLAHTYRQALLDGQPPASQHITLSTREVVLLFRPAGTILDTRGPLTDQAISQIQTRAGSSQAPFNLTLPPTHTSTHSWGWWSTTNDYRLLVAPIFNKDSRIAILMVGLPREGHTMPGFWVFHGVILLLITIIGGYWLASKAMRPMRMITRMANEINATDLRRRLDLKRRDEFGELAATFNQMLSRLEAAFKRQSQFTADASHELRTPLTIIALEINRALTQIQTPEGYRQVLELVQSENEQMIGIVNSLMLLARADTGRIEIQQETVDLSDIALGSVERLLPLAQQSQISLSTGDLPELLVCGDSQHLSRMMMNLVENAIKYTSCIGKRVSIELACEQGRWGVIRVQDDGPGIAEEHLPYLFDRFYRVDKARTHGQKKHARAASNIAEPEGTGLGLAIVQWIVQAHSGEVHVESKIGAGTLFTIRLPLLKQKMTNR